jgi:hypothetical protein
MALTTGWGIAVTTRVTLTVTGVRELGEEMTMRPV